MMNATLRARSRQRAFLARMGLDSQFHRVFDAVPDLHFFAKDRRGRLLFASRGILDHNRLREEVDVVWKTDFDLNPAAYARNYVSDDAEIYRTGKPLLNRVELWFDRVGLPDWYVTNKFPIRDKRGRIIGIMGTLENLAARRGGDEPCIDLRPALEAIRTRLKHPPTVRELAERCGMSVRHLQRRFQKIFGMSVLTFGIKTRIRAACDVLRQANRPLSVVALEAGFYDQSSFTLHFRRHTGTTPRRFQRECRA